MVEKSPSHHQCTLKAGAGDADDVSHGCCKYVHMWLKWSHKKEVLVFVALYSFLPLLFTVLSVPLQVTLHACSSLRTWCRRWRHTSGNASSANPAASVEPQRTMYVLYTEYQSWHLCHVLWSLLWTALKLTCFLSVLGSFHSWCSAFYGQ